MERGRPDDGISSIQLVLLQVLEKRMNGGMVDISNAIKCHNVYDNGAHKCATPTVVNELR
mgnify:CR=1 FL=1